MEERNPKSNHALNCTALYCTVHHITSLQYTALLCNAMHCTVFHYITLHCTALHLIIIQCTSLHCTGLQCTALQYTALHRSTLHCSVQTTHCTVTVAWPGWCQPWPLLNTLQVTIIHLQISFNLSKCTLIISYFKHNNTLTRRKYINVKSAI